ncbi:hypothetical protein N2152v2_000891 [Parachlorella kessleri]
MGHPTTDGTNGSHTDATALSALREAFKGNVIEEGQGPAYEACLWVWATSPARQLGRPAVILQPRGTSDVVAAVNFARESNLKLAVKGGGHGAGNPSFVDGGVLLDMSLMRGVYVDPVSKTVVAEGGCQLGDIDLETALHGLAVPLGVAPTTGMGLAVNGGFSIMSRINGLTCDNTLEVQMVLADGSVVTATKETDPELFWAVRGAGSSLGVVTKIRIQAYDVTEVHAGSMVWPDDPAHNNYKAILRWMRDTACSRSDIGANALRVLDPHLGPVLISMILFVGDTPVSEIEEVLRPLRDLGPVNDTVGRSSYLQLQQTFQPGLEALKKAFPKHYESWTGGHMEISQATDDFFDKFIKVSTDDLPLPDLALTQGFVGLLGGKVKETLAPVGFKEGDMDFVVTVGWHDPACHAVGQGHVQRIRDLLKQSSGKTESYINFTDAGVGARKLTYEDACDRVGGAANLERIRAVKDKYDPHNFFTCHPFRPVLAATPPQGQLHGTDAEQ